MAYLNKVQLIGNLGADPEVRAMPSGGTVANFRLATTERYTDNSGETQELTEWHRIALFGRLAEITRDYLKKGAAVYLEGKLRTRKWQGQDGQDRYTTEIIADNMQMLGDKRTGKPNAAGGENGNYKPAKDDIPDL